MREQELQRAIAKLSEFERICGQARNQKLFSALQSALSAGMEDAVTDYAFRTARDKGNGHPSYAAAVIGGMLRRGQLREEDLPGRKKTAAERNYLTQKEPAGELLDWEKRWLQEAGFAG